MGKWSLKVETGHEGAPKTNGGRLLLAALVASPGVFLMLGYFGVISFESRRPCRAIFCEPTHWQVLCIGLAFFCAGLSFVMPPRWRLVGAINSMAVLGCLLAGIVGTFFFR